MTEKEKAEETLKWLDFFDFLMTRASMYAYDFASFSSSLKWEINKIRKQCNELIEHEN